MEKEEIIKRLNELRKTFSAIENGKETKVNFNDLLINAYEIVDCALVKNELRIAEDAFALIKSIVWKDDKYKAEVINWFNSLKGKFKDVEAIAFINASIIDLQTDQVNMKNMRIICREIGKTFGSGYVNQHLQEIMGNVAISASIDKLTAKVSELIEVLKQRG